MPFPQWTTRFTKKKVIGEDHLGVEGAAQGYQQYLIPGVITTTEHARYYSFYCWVLYRYIQDPHSSRLLADFRGPYFKRHEVAFILGCYSHHQDTSGIRGLVGSNKANQMWESGDPISLDIDYYKNKLGGFGQYYRTAMQAMGLVADPERPRWVYRLTERGKALAEAFEASIHNTIYFGALDEHGQLEFLGRDAAQEYGTRACLCSPTLANGTDREPLLDAFFRFDQDGGPRNPHVRRRLTLGVLLELVTQSRDLPLRETIRPALYYGQYGAGRDYEPDPRLRDWYTRWRLVQLRHTFTTALQALWAVFLTHLRDKQDAGLTFNKFMDWAIAQLPQEQSDLLAAEYLNQLCTVVGLDGHWSEQHPAFSAACKREARYNEITLYQKILENRRDTSILIGSALRILCQLFLRFLVLHQARDSTWQELASRPRLPIAQFFDDLFYRLESPTWAIRDFLTWLYREYVLGQHEFIVLEKLRHQGYDTFKFYYQDGLFRWPYGSTYTEPLRYPALRLLNSLTILVDLGLVVEDADGVCNLTSDGQAYLSLVLEASGGD